jgi:hypothetical protein
MTVLANRHGTINDMPPAVSGALWPLSLGAAMAMWTVETFHRYALQYNEIDPD